MKSTKWTLDPTHSELGFKIKHLMITNVSGTFQKFQVDVETQEEDFSSARIDAVVEMESINTNNAQRDEHLRNSDFFEVEKNPQLLFTSTKIEKVSGNDFRLYGNLTLKGVTKPIQLNVEHSGIMKDPWGGQRAGFIVTGKINRSDWGVNFNGVMDSGGLVLGEDVKINAEIQLVKQAITVAA